MELLSAQVANIKNIIMVNKFHFDFSFYKKSKSYEKSYATHKVSNKALVQR